MAASIAPVVERRKMTMFKCALTTFDNPFNPIEEFNNWYNYDIYKGYNSSGLLDRIARTSTQLSEKENDAEIERAIDEIIRYDFLNIYKKVKIKLLA